MANHMARLHNDVREVNTFRIEAYERVHRCEEMAAPQSKLGLHAAKSHPVPVVESYTTRIPAAVVVTPPQVEAMEINAAAAVPAVKREFSYLGPNDVDTEMEQWMRAILKEKTKMKKKGKKDKKI